jgi:hypothetical protein
MNPGAPDIAVGRLREIWLHTGTACNLSCPFCHEGSAPADTRLAPLEFAHACEAIDAAVSLGVERIAFTGGEPLIHRDIMRILEYALARLPCLVLTNGTAPLVRRPHHLLRLRQAAHPLMLRVSIDYADEARHDAGRGLRNFRKALQGLKLLADAGFEVGVTRRMEPAEDGRAVDSRFRQMLMKHGLPRDLSIVALPELGPLHADAVPAYAPVAGGFREPLCGYSRTAFNHAGQLAFTACPMVDDDPRFLREGTLEEAGATHVTPVHVRCTLCRSVGIPYSGATDPTTNSSR